MTPTAGLFKFFRPRHLKYVPWRLVYQTEHIFASIRRCASDRVSIFVAAYNAGYYEQHLSDSYASVEAAEAPFAAAIAEVITMEPHGAPTRATFAATSAWGM